MNSLKPLILLLSLAAGSFIGTDTVSAQPTPTDTATSEDTAMITDFGSLVELLNRDSVTHQTEVDDQYVIIPTDKGGVDSVFVISWAGDDGVVHFIHQIPVEMPKEKLQDVETAMVRLNHAIPVPGLGINHDSGSLYFRLTVPIQPRGGMTAQEVRAFFSHTLSESERWRPILTAIIGGEASPESVVEFSNSQVAEQPNFPAGTMSREFAGGKWKMVFADDNTVKVFRDGAVAVESTFELKENKIRFSDTGGSLSVEGFGVYEWAVSDQQITFKKLEDVSEGRVMSLTTGPWSLTSE